MIPRAKHVDTILERLHIFPVVTILGPRQIGKTTLARQASRKYPKRTHWFDLERYADLNRLMEEPDLSLGNLKGLVVIDEIQCRRPDLFRVLRVLADRRPLPTRFLVLVAHLH